MTLKPGDICTYHDAHGRQQTVRVKAVNMDGWATVHTLDGQATIYSGPCYSVTRDGLHTWDYLPAWKLTPVEAV